MKTRVNLVPFNWFCFNPFNGFDVEIPQNLVRDYLDTIKKMEELHEKIIPIVEQYAELSDAQVTTFLRNRGLRALPTEVKP